MTCVGGSSNPGEWLKSSHGYVTLPFESAGTCNYGLGEGHNGTAVWDIGFLCLLLVIIILFYLFFVSIIFVLFTAEKA